MSTRNKLAKFKEVSAFPNVYENFHPLIPELKGVDGTIVDMKGKWGSDHFKNKKPITLELACGRGEYSLALARKYPERNFIGVDIKGARIWQGARIAIEEGLDNVAFLRMRIEHIENFVDKDEIDEIWITFPDPFLRKSKANRRLTSPPFLDRFKKILKSGGLIHLKTDSTELFDFTKEITETYPGIDVKYINEDIYAAPLAFDELTFKTYYEKQHLEKGKKIKYIQFTIH